MDLGEGQPEIGGGDLDQIAAAPEEGEGEIGALPTGQDHPGAVAEHLDEHLHMPPHLGAVDVVEVFEHEHQAVDEGCLVDELPDELRVVDARRGEHAQERVAPLWIDGLEVPYQGRPHSRRRITLGGERVVEEGPVGVVEPLPDQRRLPEARGSAQQGQAGALIEECDESGTWNVRRREVPRPAAGTPEILEHLMPLRRWRESASPGPERYALERPVVSDGGPPDSGGFASRHRRTRSRLPAARGSRREVSPGTRVSLCRTDGADVPLARRLPGSGG